MDTFNCWFQAMDSQYTLLPTSTTNNETREPCRKPQRSTPPGGQSLGRIWNIKFASSPTIKNIDPSKGLRVVLLSEDYLARHIIDDFEWPKSDGPINAITSALFADQFAMPNVLPLRRAGALRTPEDCAAVLHYNICKRGSHPQTIFAKLERRGMFEPIEVRNVFQDPHWADIVDREMSKLERTGAVLYEQRLHMDQWLWYATRRERSLQAAEKEVEKKNAVDRVVRGTVMAQIGLFVACALFVNW